MVASGVSEEETSKTASSSTKIAKQEESQEEMVDRTKHFQVKIFKLKKFFNKFFQAHLFASLALLSHFAKARPEMLIRHVEVFVPYLSISAPSGLEFRVLNQVDNFN